MSRRVPAGRRRRDGRRARVLATLALAGVLAGCSADASADASAETDVDAASAAPTTDLVLTSPDLDDAGALPAWASGVYGTTCAGENRSPELAWDGVPEGTRSFVVTFTDPAHPAYVHWVVTGIEPTATGLASADAGMVDGGIVGDSFRGTGSYSGPCVDGNTYVYTVYALDEVVAGDATTTLGDALAQMEGHVLDQAELPVVRASS
ncbi:YbhB/YbcL family Raf kinase inhibitor-like protein [Cellulomonas sp. P5_C5]